MSNTLTFIKENIDIQSDEPFFVFNVEDIIRKHQKWSELLPRVIPYYAVKTNPFPLLLELMIGLNLSFDCASRFEIESVLKRGAKPENIIFANPCKANSFIKYSKSVGIELMTFDNEEELVKIHSTYPEAKLVLRIRVDNNKSVVKLGLKFGADIQEVENLLRKAKALRLNVIGIAFHVGSSCQSIHPFNKAIQTARVAFDIGLKLGFNMTLLDIGGGFPGSEANKYYYKKLMDRVATFEEISALVNQSLDEYFPEPEVTIIGEPGRYYAESAFTLVTRIISKKITKSNEKKLIMYYLNDGIYGSFLDGVIDYKVYRPLPLLKNAFQVSLRDVCPSIVWGPTCDSADCIRKDFEMTEMNVGEWVLFEDMGAYSMAFSDFGFNGMPSPVYKVFVSEFAEKVLMKMKNWPKINSYLADLKWSAIYSEKVWYKMG